MMQASGETLQHYNSNQQMYLDDFISHRIKSLVREKELLEARGMSKFTNRISYRDQKTRFNILVDDNNSKIICQIKTNTKGNVIIINDKQFDIAGIEDVVNLKKELIESAQAYLK
jgi:hypothetical protein